MIKASMSVLRIDPKIQKIRYAFTGAHSRRLTDERRKLFKVFRSIYKRLTAREFIKKSFVTDIYLFE